MAVYSTVKICNTSGTNLTVDTSVSPGLDSDDWGTYTNYVANGPSAADVLWFHRNRGISADSSYVFKTTFTIDGVPVELKEKVKGTKLGSTMSQDMSAGDASTGYMQTDAPNSLTFNGASGAQYELSWSLSTAGYKDITYALNKIG